MACRCAAPRCAAAAAATLLPTHPPTGPLHLLLQYVLVQANVTGSQAPYQQYSYLPFKQWQVGGWVGLCGWVLLAVPRVRTPMLLAAGCCRAGVLPWRGPGGCWCSSLWPTYWLVDPGHPPTHPSPLPAAGVQF